MDPTRQMILARRAEIAKLRKALDDEDKELEAAERVIKRLATATKHGKGNGISAPASMSQKDLTIAALRETEAIWLKNTRELHDEIKRIFNRDVKLTNLRPMVSGLISEKVIARS